MSTVAIAHFVFVDFENVPEVDLSAIKGQPVHVTLLIGKNQKKIDLELVKQIQSFAAQVELVEVGASGRNALDLTLACYLSRAIERAPAANFAIVSKDKDFAPMIAHLLDHDVEVARYDSFTALPFLPHQKPIAPPKSAVPKKPAPAAKKPAENRRAKVIARLKDPFNRSRPSAETKLRAYITTALGKETTDAEVSDIVRALCEEGVLTIGPNNKVSYSEAAPR